METCVLCSIDTCDRQARKRGWCERHYWNWWRCGDPLGVRREYEVCTVEDCDNKPRSRTSDLCDMHYCRRWRTGLLERSTNHKERPSYRAAHSRVARAKGKAAEHPCVGCWAPAAHWSFSWQDTDPSAWLWEVVNGTSLAYSTDPDDYEPRCRRCARAYDKDFARQGWRHAHHSRHTRAEQLARQARVGT